MAKKINKKSNKNLLFVLSIVVLLLVLYFLNNGMSFNLGSSAKYIRPHPRVTLPSSATQLPRPIPTGCTSRPPCLDATPRCMIAEPADGWCPRPLVTNRPDATGQICGGIRGLGCPTGETCIYSDGRTRAPYPDASGTCKSSN